MDGEQISTNQSDGNHGAWNHAKHGEFLTALHDLVSSAKASYATLPPWLQRLLNQSAKQEYAILQSLISVGVPDVVAGGFTTDSFIKAGKDIWATLVAKNISTFTMQDIMANLNAAVASDPSAQALSAQKFATAVAALAAQPGSVAPNTGVA